MAVVSGPRRYGSAGLLLASAEGFSLCQRPFVCKQKQDWPYIVSPVVSFSGQKYPMYWTPLNLCAENNTNTITKFNTMIFFIDFFQQEKPITTKKEEGKYIFF